MEQKDQSHLLSIVVLGLLLIMGGLYVHTTQPASAQDGTPIIVDNADGPTHFFANGNWSPVPAGYRDAAQQHPAAGSAQSTVGWIARSVPAGSYDLRMTWPETLGEGVADLTVMYFSNGLRSIPVTLDQSQPPAGIDHDGMTWQSLLPQLELATDVPWVVVYMRGNGSASVLADAIGLFPTSVPDGDEEADLWIGKTAVERMADGQVLDSLPNGGVSPNEIFAYRISVRNDGPDTARNVIVSDALPAGLRLLENVTNQELFQTSGSTSFDCSPTSRTGFDCRVASMNAAAEDVIWVHVQVDDDQTCGTEFENIVLISSDTLDPNTANNSATDRTSVLCLGPAEADLTFEKDGPATIIRGQDTVIDYTITVTNNGPDRAEDLRVYDYIDFPSAFNTGGTSPECTYYGQLEGGIAICDQGGFVLDPGQTQTYTISADVSAYGCDDVVYNSGSVATAFDMLDPDRNNNWDEVVTAVECPNPESDLSIQKTGSASIVQGEWFNYIIDVVNAGPDPVTDIMVQDILPPGAAFVPLYSPPECAQNQVDPQQVDCGPISLNPGDSYRFKFTVDTASMTCGAVATNTAIVSSATNIDPIAENHRDTWDTHILCPSRSTADVSVAIQATSPNALMDEWIEYLVFVTNNGPDDLSDIVLYHSALGAPTFVTADSSTECDAQFCTVPGVLRAGQTHDFRIALRTAATRAECRDPVRFYAYARSGAIDTDFRNNGLVNTTTVVACEQ